MKNAVNRCHATPIVKLRAITTAHPDETTMTSEDRRAREKAKVQEKILAAARELFLKHGYEAVSLRKIADGEPAPVPPTIDDPAALDEIRAVLTQRAG